MGFDRLAGTYATLEALSFGGLLARARTAHLSAVASGGDVLLLGDGDGRFLEALLVERARRGAGGRVISVDASAAMLQRARRRVAGLPDAESVEFVHCPVEEFSPPDGFRAAVVCAHFFFDCFPDSALEALIARVSEWCAPRAILVLSDFAIPRRPSFFRITARAAVWAMYRFFRATAGLRARSLPDSHKALTANGWRQTRQIEWLGGFLFSATWRAGR